MIQELSAELYRLGLFWEASSLEFLCTDRNDDEDPLVLQHDRFNHNFKYVRDIALLGTSLSVDIPVKHPVNQRQLFFASPLEVILQTSAANGLINLLIHYSLMNQVSGSFLRYTNI